MRLKEKALLKDLDEPTPEEDRLLLQLMRGQKNEGTISAEEFRKEIKKWDADENNGEHL